MAGTLIWHDSRLAGYPSPGSADKIVTVNSGVTMDSALSQIGNFANGRGGLDRIDIMCHGFMRVQESPALRQSRMTGGGGLQLCKENLNNNNVMKLSALNGMVDAVVAYSCGAADTHIDNIGTNWDGQRLFGEMALYTGAVVYAADVTQWYRRLRRASPNTCTDVIDFGGWEGNLWCFQPNGSAPYIVQSNPLTMQA